MFVNALLTTARRKPKALAVDDGVRALSYSRLATLAGVMRGIIAGQAVGERVGIILPASGAFPAVLMGTLWSGKTAVPLNFLLSAEELEPIIRDAGLDLLITIRHFDEMTGRLPLRRLFLEELHLKRRLIFAMLRPYPAVPRVDPEDTAVILYTSGTTAQPKGVELSYSNLYSNCIDTIASLNIDPQQRFLNILPPFHVFGLTGNVLVPIILGASVYAMPRFNPVAAVKTIEEKKISVILAIPSMYGAMLRTKSARAESFASVYLAISGGEPLPESVRAGFEERFHVKLKQGYGLTETSPVLAACSPAAFRDGTVGKPVRNVEFKLVDAEGKEVAREHDGEILVRGPGVMKGYYRKPEETAKVLSKEGWLSTGDIGRFDADGYLSITGRAKEMLIIGGENVFPREIEAVVESHPGVLQAAVIGVPDDVRGEVPAAFVIPKPGVVLSESELRNFAKQSLAGFKVPRRIEIREDLPTSPTGKILKRKLRELL